MNIFIDDTPTPLNSLSPRFNMPMKPRQNLRIVLIRFVVKGNGSLNDVVPMPTLKILEYIHINMPKECRISRDCVLRVIWIYHKTMIPVRTKTYIY